MASGRPSGADRTKSMGLRWNAWNLLLLVPLAMLFTPMLNMDAPRVFGLPFFYWSQFAFVPLGVICVGLVYIKTKDEPVVTDKPDHLSVDDLDEGGKA
ncbi:DUF3311 domain-containing protein [Allokutzneria sp. A3M-2-11 16]|uniref:DUF3311 domain-containing protein n=1 Tax=Allokutzneria sp. A3M-2-11 16 TaxID=2962043 RepID=UPI0020B7BD6A|nr:DUF3311 domain-containing protein [Allokutzneria sp. A3M-2-11 16]MCP3799382.1 DUF3311 domain-containing protein [Allokutzneria sp. A3M-2-11 16]